MFTLKTKDLRRFTDIMNNIPEEEVESRPLPPSHWINQPVEVSVSVLQGQREFKRLTVTGATSSLSSKRLLYTRR
jgi:hypothetical protein